jgi:hypothetical protein
MGGQLIGRSGGVLVEQSCLSRTALKFGDIVSIQHPLIRLGMTGQRAGLDYGPGEK